MSNNLSNLSNTATESAAASSRAHVGDAIERMKVLFAAKPGLARKTNASATAVLGKGLQCEITGPDGERAMSDMPPPMGGESAGPNPGWFLRASMASCLATTIAARAAVTGIVVERLVVSAHSESDLRGLLGIDNVSAALMDLRVEVSITAPAATPQQLGELIAWAESHAPVTCTVRAAAMSVLNVENG